MIISRNGKRTEANLRLSGGVDKTTYSTSFGALEEQGYLINSEYQRYNTRVDVGHEVKKRLKGAFNLGYTYAEASQTGQESNATSAFWFANNIPSIYPVFLRDSEGKYVKDEIFGGHQYDFGNNQRGFGLGSNPVGTTIHDIDQYNIHELNGNTFLEASFLKHFKAMVKFGVQYQNFSRDNRGSPLYGFSSSTNGNIYKQKVSLALKTFLQFISYKNSFGLHNVEAKLFHESQAWDYYYLSAFKTELADPYSVELNNAAVNHSASSYELEYRIESFFGKLDYNFDEKYFASIVVRRDGSSRFLNNKWGNFYSLGTAWVASKEEFLSDVSWIDFLKLKASYGTNGDEEGDNTDGEFGASFYSGYDLYDVNNLNDKVSFAFRTKGNPDLTWESSKQYQVGLEVDLFDRFQAQLDYYVKETDNLLVNEPKATQAHIYLFIESEKIPLEDIPKVEAFNQYFSGGFNGLVIKEIRENRGLAYSAGASLSVPTYRDWTTVMSGYVGTQADKTSDAVEVLVELLKEMPEYPNRINGVTKFLINGSEVEYDNKFSFLLASHNWKEMGYQGNPLAYKLPLYDKITFDNIRDAYQKMVKNKKYAIGIVGKISDMDQDKLETYGKVVKINKNSLFSEDYDIIKLNHFFEPPIGWFFYYHL